MHEREGDERMMGILFPLTLCKKKKTMKLVQRKQVPLDRSAANTVFFFFPSPIPSFRSQYMSSHTSERSRSFNTAQAWLSEFKACPC